MNKVKSLLSYAALVSLVLLAACGSDDDNSINISQVLVINEGNFSAANGNITSYNPEDGSITPSYFEGNTTIQRARQRGNQLYLVGNAPDQVEIVDLVDERSEAVINQGFLNPIDIAFSNQYAFITNWGDINLAFGPTPASYIAVMDLFDNEVVDSIMLPARPQEIALNNGRIYIAYEGGSALGVINPADGPDNFSLGTIEMPAGPSALLTDAEGDLWVLCTSGSLVEINTRNNSIIRQLDGLTTGSFNEKAAIDLPGNMIYYLGGTNSSFTGRTTVYSVDLGASELAASILVEDGFSLYGVGINPENGQVYVGDNNAFQSTGTGLVYDETGTELDQFGTGIGPNGFIFF